MIKSFTMDYERLKGNGGGNYGKNCLAVSETSVHLKRCIVKSLIYMLQAKMLDITENLELMGEIAVYCLLILFIKFL